MGRAKRDGHGFLDEKLIMIFHLKMHVRRARLNTSLPLERDVLYVRTQRMIINHSRFENSLKHFSCRNLKTINS